MTFQTSEDEEEGEISGPSGRTYKPVAQRIQMGKELRNKVPREEHAIWDPPSDRPDPVDMLISTEKGRLQELLPIRHERMGQNPLVYLRGAAAMMAYDLSRTATTGVRVQACGDCHLGNFGFFATPAETGGLRHKRFR